VPVRSSPVATPKPVAHPHPAAPAKPKPVAHPHPTAPATPKPVAHPHPTAPAKPKPVAKPTPAPKPVAKPKPVPAAKPVPKPVAKPKPIAVTKPAPKPAPAPAAPVAAGHYVNPLAGASVTPERIDQGVDYSGSGTLSALGDGRVVYVGVTGTGWPGAFIEYRLTDGADSGRYVYYAEGVSPADGIHVGETLSAGQPVAQIIPGSSSGIEIGWGSGLGSQTLAEANGDWGGSDDANSVASPEGRDFSALIASLGGPPGKIEG
jgi:hypothetical protein